jgi:hypothetical protein
MSRRCFLAVAKYVLALALLAWVVVSNWAPPPHPDHTESHGLGYVWQHHVIEGKPIQGWFLLGGITFYILGLFITLFRWHFLVRALDLPLSLRDAIRYGLVGIFFNTFLPGAVGGDIIKAAALARTQNRRTAAVATVIMDRVIALWALFWFVAILGVVFRGAGFLTGPTAFVASTITLFCLSIVIVSYALWLSLGFLTEDRADRFATWLTQRAYVGSSLGELWRAIWIYRQRQRAIVGVMLLTWVSQIAFVLAFWCCACTLWGSQMGPIPSLLQHFLLVPIGLTMQALVPTPGGAGGGEWGFAALYVLFHAPGANGVLASLVVRILSWILGAAGYGVYLWLSRVEVGPFCRNGPLHAPRSDSASRTYSDSIPVGLLHEANTR